MGSGVRVAQLLEQLRELPVFVPRVDRPSVGVAEEPNRIELEDLAEL